MWSSSLQEGYRKVDQTYCPNKYITGSLSWERIDQPKPHGVTDVGGDDLGLL